MLTISRLAAYAGVTVRAVRHYHRIGLLAEPERDRSGYRTYGAAAVVRLIRGAGAGCGTRATSTMVPRATLCGWFRASLLVSTGA